MSNQAQVDALEHLLIAVLKTNGLTLSSARAFETAHGSIMGSDGPPGTDEKSAANTYLEHLKMQFK